MGTYFVCVRTWELQRYTVPCPFIPFGSAVFSDQEDVVNVIIFRYAFYRTSKRNLSVQCYSGAQFDDFAKALGRF
jgi:hypothetical protein